LRRLAPSTGRVVRGHVPLSAQSKALVHRVVGIHETLGRDEVATDAQLLAITRCWRAR
jgi:hypothetical protein